MNIIGRPGRRLVAVTSAVLLAGGLLTSCGSDDTASDEATSSESGSAVEVSVSDAWARPAQAALNGAVYMELVGGDSDDALVGASVDSSVATGAELHQTMGDVAEEDADHSHGDDGEDHSHDDDSGDMGASGDMDGDDADADDADADDGDDAGGMMTMEPVDEIEVPSGLTVSLVPGGLHLMLVDLQEELVAGDSVDVTLTFESGLELDVTAEVRDS